MQRNFIKFSRPSSSEVNFIVFRDILGQRTANDVTLTAVFRSLLKLTKLPEIFAAGVCRGQFATKLFTFSSVASEESEMIFKHHNFLVLNNALNMLIYYRRHRAETKKRIGSKKHFEEK